MMAGPRTCLVVLALLRPAAAVDGTTAASYNAINYEESDFLDEGQELTVDADVEWTLVKSTRYKLPAPEAPMQLLMLTPRTATPRPTIEPVDMIILAGVHADGTRFPEKRLLMQGVLDRVIPCLIRTRVLSHALTTVSEVTGAAKLDDTMSTLWHSVVESLNVSSNNQALMCARTCDPGLRGDARPSSHTAGPPLTTRRPHTPAACSFTDDMKTGMGDEVPPMLAHQKSDVAKGWADKKWTVVG